MRGYLVNSNSLVTALLPRPNVQIAVSEMSVLDICAFLRSYTTPKHNTTHHIMLHRIARYPVLTPHEHTHGTDRLHSMKHLRVFVDAFIDREMTGAKVRGRRAISHQHEVFMNTNARYANA